MTEKIKCICCKDVIILQPIVKKCDHDVCDNCLEKYKHCPICNIGQSNCEFVKRNIEDINKDDNDIVTKMKAIRDKAMSERDNIISQIETLTKLKHELDQKVDKYNKLLDITEPQKEISKTTDENPTCVLLKIEETLELIAKKHLIKVNNDFNKIRIFSKIGRNTERPEGWSIGLFVNDNNFVFHPGYPGGAFRIDGPFGHGNLTMSFQPIVNKLYDFEVIIHKNGDFIITIKDESHEYKRTFYKKLVTDIDIGLYRDSLPTAPNDVGLFSDILITKE